MINYKDKLADKDIYTFLLFAIFKLTDDPQYSTLSELFYLFDKQTVFKFLDYYGGMTIKIPTRDELITLVDALVVYETVNKDNMSVEEALKKHKVLADRKAITAVYDKLTEVLNDYKFK